mgnify:CR=1 FL=1
MKMSSVLLARLARWPALLSRLSMYSSRAWYQSAANLSFSSRTW